MEGAHRGSSAQLHSVQIRQELQVFFQGLAAKDRIQDLAVSNTLDTVSKNLAHSRAYRLACLIFLINRRPYSGQGRSGLLVRCILAQSSRSMRPYLYPYCRIVFPRRRRDRSRDFLSKIYAELRGRGSS